jgi:RNA polymerase primary sigma factor
MSRSRTDSITEGDLVSSGEDITDGMDEAAVTQAIEDTIGILPVRDQQLMRLRYGIGQPDNREHTLAEISAITGVSRERVRQVIQLSLRLMGQSDKARILRQTLER